MITALIIIGVILIVFFLCLRPEYEIGDARDLFVLNWYKDDKGNLQSRSLTDEEWKAFCKEKENKTDE